MSNGTDFLCELKQKIQLHTFNFSKHISIQKQHNYCICMEKRNYDLGKRTLQFAKKVRSLVSNIPRSYLNDSDLRQLIRASGSVAANYAEANEAESKKDFAHKCKICRKESKESWVWLNIIEPFVPAIYKDQHKMLLQESLELTKIFTAIVRKMDEDHTQNL